MPFSYSNTSSGSRSPTSSESNLSFDSDRSSSSLLTTQTPKPSTPPLEFSPLQPELTTLRSDFLTPTPSERPGLKPSLKSSEAIRQITDRKPSPAVRFAEPEPTPKSNTKPKEKRKSVKISETSSSKSQSASKLSTSSKTQSSSKRQSAQATTQYHNGVPFASPTARLSKQINNSQSNSAPAPPNISRPNSLPVSRTMSIQAMKRRMSPKSLEQEADLEPDPRWVGIPLPAHFTPPRLGPNSRVTSYQSTNSAISGLSMQSAPAALETPPPLNVPSGQYNSLEHYIPCMYPSCKVHYTPAHLGPSFYLPSGPYNISHLHAHCPRHAVHELKEANATLKRAYEVLRQNAGRKTLGAVAAEFEELKDEFRDHRRLRDAKLIRMQKRRVLGVPSSSSPSPGDGEASDEKKNELASSSAKKEKEVWDWRYTQRPCISATCKEHYTPYSNHLYTFYRTPQPGTSFFPLQTFCPKCAKQEMDEFALDVKQKWGSRCGWDRKEWLEWLENKVKDREMEQDYWVKAQERVVRKKGPARWVRGLENDVVVERERQEVKKCERTMRKSGFKRWVASMAV